MNEDILIAFPDTVQAPKPGPVRIVDDAVDKITSFPRRIDEFADQVNDEIIDIINRIKEGKATIEDTAKANLTQNKTRSFFKKTFDWVQKNLLVSGLILVGAILLIRRI